MYTSSLTKTLISIPLKKIIVYFLNFNLNSLSGQIDLSVVIQVSLLMKSISQNTQAVIRGRRCINVITIILVFLIFFYFLRKFVKIKLFKIILFKVFYMISRKQKEQVLNNIFLMSVHFSFAMKKK